MMTLFLLRQFIENFTPVLILHYQGILFNSCQLIWSSYSSLSNEKCWIMEYNPARSRVPVPCPVFTVGTLRAYGGPR